MATRGRPPGQPKSGGRVVKSLDRQARTLVSNQLAHSILATFEMLGGTAAMVEWAHGNKTVFYTQILSRLMPAPQKDEADIQVNQQFNFDSSPAECARRVAFALALGVYDDPSRAIEAERDIPEFSPNMWRPPTDAPHLAEPSSTPYEAPIDPERSRWAADLALSPGERRAADVIRDTHESSIESYRGCDAQQALGPVHSPNSHQRDPRAAQRDRMLQRRRKDLL